MPMADLPGIGATMRISGVASAYEMSSVRRVTAATLTPVPREISKRVTVGPRYTLETDASTPNCASVRSRARVIWSWLFLLPVATRPVRNISIGGS
jgi:hypothetical protein